MRPKAASCISKARYLRDRLQEAGLAPKYEKEFFHEFVTVGPEGTNSQAILGVLEAEGILGGLPLSEREILWCATEMNTKEEMDQTAAIVKAAVSGSADDRQGR